MDRDRLLDAAGWALGVLLVVGLAAWLLGPALTLPLVMAALTFGFLAGKV